MIAVRGTLSKRSPETINPDLATGEVELMGKELRLLNAAQVPPFTIEDETEANENTRLKYRYLDLRRPQSLASSRIALSHDQVDPRLSGRFGVY